MSSVDVDLSSLPLLLLVVPVSLFMFVDCIPMKLGGILECRRDSAGFICILMQKRLPLLAPLDSTPTEPPHCSTIILTMVKPRPIPSLLMLEVRCSLPN